VVQNDEWHRQRRDVIPLSGRVGTPLCPRHDVGTGDIPSYNCSFGRWKIENDPLGAQVARDVSPLGLQCSVVPFAV
jgi:hypothetical protein